MAPLSSTAAPLRISEDRTFTARMAKASLGEVRKADPERELAGKCVERAREALGWNLDEFTARLPKPASGRDRDQRQVRRWETGEDPQPIHLFMQLPDFWVELLWQYAHAKPDPRIEPERGLRFKRTA